MATMHGAAPDDDGIQRLFDSSPDVEVHTSAAAEGAFLLGLAALLAAPFAVMQVAALVRLRYLGLDTGFRDRFVPTMGGWLESLNSRFPHP